MTESLAVAKALHALPERTTATICTDSMTCIAWWKHYVDNPKPWKAAHRRATTTHKVWEWAAAKIAKRSRNGTTTAIKKVKAHAGITGNELADQLAKEAAASADIPAWSLNTSPAPVTQRNLLLSGVNFLHPPLKVLKQQAKTLHAARIRQRIVGKHPELADRLPAMLWQKIGPEARTGADGEKQDTWLQAFALKLALRTLPTINRQHS